ncbi:DUF459 domain-containing protein [candidate division WOR-3 bacterium]|nr:DUF459 domain-containing protein [candidate division WOR-3 bacterium]
MDFMEKFRYEKSYTLATVTKILLVCLLFVVIFDSTGLNNWAKKLRVGPVRSFFLTFTEPLAFGTSSLNLDFPRKSLKNIFLFSMGKQREAGFIGAEDPALTVVEIPIENTAPQDNTNVVVYSSSSPVSILLLGDSMMGDGLGTMLIRDINESPDMTQKRYFKVSSGMTRPDFYNWPAQVGQIFSTENYDIVIIMMGTNDAQNFEMDGKIYTYGTEEWFEVYRQRVTSFVAYLTQHTSRVYWIGMPPMRSSGYNSRMKSLNVIFEEVCGQNTKATYFSTVPILGDASGNYSTYITSGSRQIQARDEKDGIHMTRAGGQLVSDSLLTKIRQDFTFED